jgi:hypothetical protein
MPFPGLWGRFDRILIVRKQRFIVCRNLQFSSTKWAKAYLINYILNELQESMGNIFIFCSLSRSHGLNDKGLHDFEKGMIISKLLGGGGGPLHYPLI